MTETKQEEGKFVGINWLTGRKIYLTPKEEATIKKQMWKSVRIILWIFGIFIFLMVLLFIWVSSSYS